MGKKTGILVALVVLLSSCSFLFKTVVDDARVTSVVLRDYEDVRTQPGPPQPGRRVLIVSFDTSTDIGSITFERQLYLGGDVKLCATDEKIYPVFVSKQDTPFSNPGYVTYDLSSLPQDICVVIRGHPYMGVGTGLTTTPIIVTKATIEKALTAVP
jgi:hypothetical protein